MTDDNEVLAHNKKVDTTQSFSSLAGGVVLQNRDMLICCGASAAPLAVWQVALRTG